MHMQMCVVGTLFALYVLPLVITMNPALGGSTPPDGRGRVKGSSYFGHIGTRGAAVLSNLACRLRQAIRTVPG